MPRRRPRTRAELIARLLDGPFSVERDALVLWYRLTLPDDPERRDAIVIALAPEFGFLLQEYDPDSAYAVVQGKVMPLTRWQADAVASRMRQMLRVHGGTLAPRTPTRLRAGSKSLVFARRASGLTSLPLEHARDRRTHHKHRSRRS